jgi:Domain of unknown function (DUF4258)
MGLDTILARIRVQASARAIRVTDHAREEMEEEAVTLAEVFEAISVGQIIEHYPTTGAVHVVCSTGKQPGDVPCM